MDHDDLMVARELLREVRASGKARSWRKVTTLLHRYGASRLTDSVRERIASSLAAAGLTVDPPIARVQRFDSVRLALATDAVPLALGKSGAVQHVTVTRWLPGQRSEAMPVERAHRGEGVLWIDLDHHAEPSQAYQLLHRLCGQDLTPEMVQDLLEADELPKRILSEDGRVQRVSAVSAAALEREREAEDSDASKAGTLRFELVEMVAGDGWIITTRHRARTFCGVSEDPDGDPIALAALYHAVGKLWLGRSLATSGDLGTAILLDLAATYSEAARNLSAWIEQWELSFHQDDAMTERVTLTEVRGLAAHFRRRLQAFNLPTRRDDAESWFEGVTAPALVARVDELTDRGLADLAAIADALRTSMDVLTARSIAKQLALSQEQADRTSHLQNTVGLVTSVLLVPTLIGSVFGANTKLPGGNAWSGFIGMMLLMVVGSGAAYIAFRAAQKRTERELEQAPDILHRLR